MFGRILSRANLLILFSVASELLVAEIRRRQCRFPTIDNGRETALLSPLYDSGAYQKLGHNTVVSLHTDIDFPICRN